MKPHFYFEKLGIDRCKGCDRRTNGHYVRHYEKSTRAVDGQLAFKIYFVCKDKAHLEFLGYSRPVDFTDGAHTKSSQFQEKSYEEEEMEERMEWQELTGTKAPF